MVCSQTTVVIGGSNECVQGPALPGTTCASGEGEAAQAGTAAGGAETADWKLFGGDDQEQLWREMWGVGMEAMLAGLIFFSDIGEILH